MPDDLEAVVPAAGSGSDTSSSTKDTPPPEVSEKEPEIWDDEDDDITPPEEAKEDAKEEDQEGRLPVEEKKEGGESKPEEKKKTSIAESEEKTPSTEKEPATPPETVKLKLGEKEYDIPKDAYEEINRTVERATEIQNGWKTLAQDLVDKHSETYLDLLTSINGGDRDKAYEQMIEEYAKILKREIDFRSLPEPEQKATLAERKAARLEAELKQFREREAEEKRRIQEAQEQEAIVGDIVRSMNELGFKRDDKNGAEHRQFALDTFEEYKKFKAAGKPVNAAELVKLRKNQQDKEESEREKRAVQRLLQNREKLIKDYPELISIAREKDIAELKNGAKAPAKTATEKRPEAERKPEPRSVKKSMNTASWDDHFYRR